MSTYTQILYQIVFCTRNRERTITEAHQNKLYGFITGILKNKQCHLYRIGGVEDHLHIVTHLHPSIALADLIKDIKLASTAYIKSEHLFPNFRGWQNGYGAFTYDLSAKENLISYVKNQGEHHKKVNFHDEYRQLLIKHDIDFEEKYLL